LPECLRRTLGATACNRDAARSLRLRVSMNWKQHSRREATEKEEA
jgi:hypothetical protein